jgi:hypothetical protein
LDYKLLDSSIYDFCVKNSLDLITWTIRNKENFEKVKEKVDAVIFESLFKL